MLLGVVLRMLRSRCIDSKARKVRKQMSVKADLRLIGRNRTVTGFLCFLGEGVRGRLSAQQYLSGKQDIGWEAELPFNLP